MKNKNDYFYSLTFDNANLIANRIAQGEPITITGGRCSGKTTLELATLFEIYDKVIELKSRIKMPYAIVMNPETFEKFAPQLLRIKEPINLPLSERFNGISMHVSQRVPKGLIKIAWTLQELLKIVNGEKA